MKLNARQKSFCEFYVASGNATEYAIKAGYKEKTSRVTASKMLTKANIKLLDKLQEIGKDIDGETDRLKIMIYDKYLDRCRESLKKKREMDKEIRQMTQKIKDKISKK